MLENLQNQLEPISKFFYIITHPRIIFDWMVVFSYWWAVLVSTISFIFYIATKSIKAKQICIGMIVAYILLKSISSVL